MPLMHLGRNNVAALVSGAGKAYDSTGACIHVSSATSDPPLATSTDLGVGGGGSVFVSTMESGYPTLSTNQVTFRGVASTAQANFNWSSWGIDSTTSTGGQNLLNRIYEDLGTKSSAQSWQFTADLTFTT